MTQTNSQSRLPLRESPRSICILRFSALGDVTHMTPVVRTLQREWPETAITWIVGKAEHALVGDIAGVDFRVFDKTAGLRGYRDLWRQLRGKRFDVLLHNQFALRANIASLGIRAGLRLGYDKARSRDFHGLFVNARIPPHPGQHVIDIYFSFIETLGVSRRHMVWDIPVPPEADAKARQWIPNGSPSLVISPCSSHHIRSWSAEQAATVAEHAVRQHDLQVLVTGSPAGHEQALCAAIAEQAAVPVTNLAGQTSIKETLALLGRATVVISPDSGPAHMANAMGRPVIGLYACTNPGRARPYYSGQWCVDKYDEAARMVHGKPASELRWGTKIERPGVMDLISAADVIERLDALMESGATHTGR
ncbi:glycosyltransferase family 9 protein [Methylonatrum kenyense]|uniref:glycosyltransferase family 9 protein n=1 Tax=Methylonatrum kenyense TaxID=455253 RepID=UPI0020BD93FF|nr:glycosyltransferase family 9 protein [Methylonatrum kenyense]MCK8516990.1 glycosyltransferase family 9 protein [Methylonatrum kenyense]